VEGHAYTAAAPRTRGAAGSRWSGPGSALALCALCLLAGALVWALASYVPAVRVKDALVLEHVSLHNHGAANWVAERLIRLLEPVLFVLWGIALVSLSLAQGRARAALAVGAVMALAPLSAELLKPLLAHPHLPAGDVYIGPASWPSGHSTAASALALCAVLVAPARMRPFVSALALAFAAAVGAALLIRGAHMPSDVVGGFLLAGFWAALALAGLRAADRRRPTAAPGDAPPAQGMRTSRRLSLRRD
jgi:membrane-associated phospholipid phosphatase